MANSEGGSSGEESDIDSKNQDIDLDDIDIPEKKMKPGIIYLSNVPEGMSVAKTTSFFAEFGRVGRMRLVQSKTFKWSKRFDEGWVEFLSKKVARRVAEQINNTEVKRSKKKAANDGQIWNIKYLPRFKWVHLSERLNYEKARKFQKMRTEIEQVKKSADHFKSSVKIRKKRKAEDVEKDDIDQPQEKRPYVFKQVEVQRNEDRQQSETSIKPKSKKTKKGHKSKDKDVSPKIKMSPTKQTKSKKESRKSGSKSPSVGKGISAKKSGSRTPKKSPVPSFSMRRRSGDSFQAGSSATAGEGGGGGRNAFLKSVFGGGAS